MAIWFLNMFEPKRLPWMAPRFQKELFELNNFVLSLPFRCLIVKIQRMPVWHFARHWTFSPTSFQTVIKSNIWRGMGRYGVNIVRRLGFDQVASISHHGHHTTPLLPFHLMSHSTELKREITKPEKPVPIGASVHWSQYPTERRLWLRSRSSMPVSTFHSQRELSLGERDKEEIYIEISSRRLTMQNSVL